MPDKAPTPGTSCPALPPEGAQPPSGGRAAAEVRYRHERDHVVVSISGSPTLDEFLAALQEVGADSVAWPGSHVIVDLRGVSTQYAFTEQLRIGEAVGRNLGHLQRVAAVVPPERITRVGEKVANRTGVRAGVFRSEAEALAWLREAPPGC